MKKDAQDKKTIPKKSKVKVRAQTQDELIARALDMEEGNIFEHRNYLFVEEEKRKRALAVRTAISGPLLRWVSRRETLSVPSEGQLSDGRNGASSSILGASVAKLEVQQPTNGVDVPLPIPAVKFHTENVAKNYVIHEMSQDESATRPPWKDTMAAMFGSHVKWEDVRTYVSRGRPLSRPTQLCPVTGRPARYRDPRTKVPYATPAAYQTLTMILNHEYVWSKALGCYVTRPEMFAFPSTAQSGETTNGDQGG